MQEIRKRERRRTEIESTLTALDQRARQNGGVNPLA
jgi:hypothetical protein